MNYDDETLMAYADGELDEAQKALIAAAVERDPALARRVEQHRALRAEVAGAFAAVLDQPVPERLVTIAQAAATAPAAELAPSGKVLQFPALTPRVATAWRAREWGAMAASLVLGALISWKVFAPSDAALITARDGALVARGALASALDQQLASNQGGEEPVLIGLTFKSRDGSFCRSFALRQSATAGLACHVDGAWRIPVTATAQDQEGFRQAASPPPAVLQAIEARISGEALDAAAEENARRSGWNARRE